MQSKYYLLIKLLLCEVISFAGRVLIENLTQICDRVIDVFALLKFGVTHLFLVGKLDQDKQVSSCETKTMDSDWVNAIMVGMWNSDPYMKVLFLLRNRLS